MLIDLETGRPIMRMPRQAQYRAWMSRLSSAEIATAKAAINAMIERGEIHTAGWMPGKQWAGTPFEPLHTKAARGDREASGLCFGALVWEVFAERPECWASGRYEKNGKPIGSRTYFRIEERRRGSRA
ncbi:hypothetical protein [Teichococcus oryzae]|uniref:Uncharacterized protein n=1 Tax=Teichococcus oryzae TaxID=1608942 RepID=A0A5B2TBZ0_9PROT|nr:hypothetical protein [Pseudoroseomonas oryzae]KAA2211358.1 hypothetical protein F0Q34_20455 [Pseudoroseomonas oryzae]